MTVALARVVALRAAKKMAISTLMAIAAGALVRSWAAVTLRPAPYTTKV